MDPFLIGILVVVPMMYILLVGGLNFMKRRRKLTPVKTS